MSFSVPRPRAGANTLLLFVLLSLPLRAASPWDSTDVAAPPAAPPVAPPAMPVSTGPAPLDTIWSDTKAFAVDALRLFGRPLGFDGSDWAVTGGVLAATGGGMLIDDRVRSTFSTGTNTRLTDLTNSLGTPLPALAIAAPLYVGGLIADAPRFRVAGRHVVQAVTYAAVITTTAKVLIGRHRPFLAGTPPEDARFRFEGPSTRDDYNSLPSGHTTLAFALCSTLAAEIDNPWATVGLYSLAALTGVTRIYVDRHWTSDVILGAAIGTACGYGVVNLDRESVSHASLQIIPSLSGITALVTF